jgi:ABC-type multidrug transport system ATPase subunit
VQPILAAVTLRVDVAGLPAVDRLSFTTGGDRVLVLGAAGALFEAAAGLRPTMRGELLVQGAEPREAVRAGVAASAPLDPPLPPGWTVGEYVTWSARLAGHRAAEAAVLARQALEGMELETFRRAKLGSASRHVRRATVVAGALATGASALLLEDPLAALPAEASLSLARRIVSATAGRRTALFAARIPLESPIAVAADEAIVVDGPHIAMQGLPAEVAASAGAFTLRVTGDVTAFTAAVRAHGGTVQVPEDPPGLQLLSVQLGPLGTRDLLKLADESQAIVLELRPIGHAFA